VAEALAAKDDIVALTLPVLPNAGVVSTKAGPAVCDALTKVVPAGTGSIIVALMAATAPWFCTNTV
jgi:hypothetical protein